MDIDYHLDPKKISLEKLRRSLESRELIPSRMILKENLKANFEVLASAGVNNMDDLIKALKSKNKVDAFSKQTGLEVGYLTILRREANSYFPNPVRLSSFPGIDQRVISKLDEHGIKNSKQLFNAAKSSAEREKLCSETGLTDQELREVVHLSDLARLYGVGPVFARLLYDIGIDSVESFIKCSPKEIIRMYEDTTNKKADFSEKDILFTLELARDF